MGEGIKFLKKLPFSVNGIDILCNFGTQFRNYIKFIRISTTTDLDIESPKQLSRDKMRGCIFENFIVLEILKHRFNQGLENGVFFYRDSNQNEVDILLKQEGEITAIEVKSSSTYTAEFEKSLKKIQDYVKTPVARKIVVYSGDFENTAGDIKVVNYKNLSSVI